MKPLQDILIVKEVESKTKIVLPDGVEKDSTIFEVIQAGKGHWEFGIFIPVEVKPKDKVFIVGKAAKFKDGEKEYLFTRARDVIAIM